MGEFIKNYSDKQRNALHAWCHMSAKALNNAGMFRHSPLNYKRVYKWDKDSFKIYIYKEYLRVALGKTSTEQQSSVDPSEVYLAISSHIQQEHDVVLPEWPSAR